MVIPNWVRFVNKGFTNRLMMLIAGGRGSPIAVVGHTGRRSGKSYRTPVMVAPIPGGFIFALTYGPGVDWFRNVLAAGRCSLRWQGKDFALRAPEKIGRAAALPAFHPLPRLLLRIAGMQHFFRMETRPGLHKIGSPAGPGR
jgi:deazaflavin-dependent oxidoreductase (nitroreductase family)